jgi:hypothetical protein
MQVVKSISFLFHADAMLLFYITQRIIFPKFCIFQTSVTVHHCTDVLQVVPVLIPSHKSVCHVGITDH